MNSFFQNTNQQGQNPQIIEGGYPYGYPPFMPQFATSNPGQSPFPNPAPFSPGMDTPLEVTDKNGNTTIIPPQNMQYSQGGATYMQGGFNPVTGNINPQIGVSGYSSNPYTNPQLIGNPGYSFNNQQPNSGYGVYEPPNYPRPQQFQPFGYHGQPMPQYGYPVNPYYNPYYAQNQFNTAIQEYLYEEAPFVFDPTELLANIVLTDEEKEKIYRKRNYIGQDYYGRPIYANSYQESQNRQKEFEEARKNCQDYYTTLSKIAHKYDGEEIDVEETRKRFDPLTYMPQPIQPKVFNWNTASEQEKLEYQRDMRVMSTNELAAKFNNLETLENNAKMQKQLLYSQIKATHDKLIGVQPGQHYDLKTFMDNGYKIGINIAQQKARAANRNGQTKYTSNSYRQGMAQNTNTQIPITSKDDEFVSIEEVLKGVYEKNRRINNVLSQQKVGDGLYTSPEAISQNPEFSSEREAHQYFINEMQKKKIQDEIKRSVM